MSPDLQRHLFVAALLLLALVNASVAIWVYWRHDRIVALSVIIALCTSGLLVYYWNGITKALTFAPQLYSAGLYLAFVASVTAFLLPVAKKKFATKSG